MRYCWLSQLILETYHFMNCPVGQGWRIHRLLLYRGIWPLLNECLGLDTKQSDGEVSVMLELWGMQNTPSLPLIPGPLRLRVVAPDRVLLMGHIKLNGVLRLNWNTWNRTVFDIETAHLKWNCSCMLNWIVWNRTVFDIETELTLNWIVWNRTVLTFNCV